MRRRSKPDQIEERRSVSSVCAGKSTHGSRTTRCRRVEMRFEVFMSSGSSMSAGNIGPTLTFAGLVAACCPDDELR